jgi:hypothetical protein
MKVENNANGKDDPGYFTEFIKFDENSSLRGQSMLAINRYEYNTTHLEAILFDADAITDGRLLWSTNGAFGHKHSSTDIKPTTAVKKLRNCNGANVKTPWLVIKHHDVAKLRDLAENFWSPIVQNQIHALIPADAKLRSTGKTTTNVELFTKRPINDPAKPTTYDPFEL